MSYRVCWKIRGYQISSTDGFKHQSGFNDSINDLMLMEHGTSHQQIKYGHNDCICGQYPQRVTGYIAYMYI